MKPAKIELLSKVIVWRFFSMLYGFAVALSFTGNATESAGIVLLTGSSLTFLQWGFEVLWDRHARHRIRHVLSRQRGRIGWLHIPATQNLKKNKKSDITLEELQEKINAVSGE